MQKLSQHSSSSLLRSLLHYNPLSTTTNTPSSLSSDVEKIYRTLRLHHSSSPQSLSLALQSLSPSLPSLHHSSLLPSVLSRCGPSTSLALSFLSFATTHLHPHPSPLLHKSLLSLLSKSCNFPASWSLIQHLHLHLHHPNSLPPEFFLILIRRFAKSRLIPKPSKCSTKCPSMESTPTTMSSPPFLTPLPRTMRLRRLLSFSRR